MTRNILKIKIILCLSTVSLTMLYAVIESAAAVYEDRGIRECSKAITEGRQTVVIESSKAALRKDRWDPAACACYSMAYYSKGDTERAVKKLREAEETLPKEIVDAIHDLLWDKMPELLAEKEYKDNFAVAGGDCILRNVKALAGNGYLVIGNYYNPFNKAVSRHLRGYRCPQNAELSEASCLPVDLVCPDCEELEREAVVTVQDFDLASITILVPEREFSRNVRYIKKVLQLQKR